MWQWRKTAIKGHWNFWGEVSTFTRQQAVAAFDEQKLILFSKYESSWNYRNYGRKRYIGSSFPYWRLWQLCPCLIRYFLSLGFRSQEKGLNGLLWKTVPLYSKFHYQSLVLYLAVNVSFLKRWSCYCSCFYLWYHFNQLFSILSVQVFLVLLDGSCILPLVLDAWPTWSYLGFLYFHTSQALWLSINLSWQMTLLSDRLLMQLSKILPESKIVSAVELTMFKAAASAVFLSGSWK